MKTPEGYSLERTDDTLRALEERLGKLPHVTHLLTTIGDVSGRLRAGEGPVTTGSVYVRLSELKERELSQTDIMKDARAIMAEYPDLRSSVQNVNLFVSGGQRFSDLEFDLTGPSLAKLENYAAEIMDRMNAVGGFVDVDTTLSVRQPELRVEISREKAAIFGINVRDGRRTRCARLIGGEPISTYREEQDQIDVWLRAQRAQPQRPARHRRRHHRDAARRAGAPRQPRQSHRGARPGADRPSQPPAQGHAGRQPRRHCARHRGGPRAGDRRRSWTCRRPTASPSAAAPSRSARPAPTSCSPSC